MSDSTPGRRPGDSDPHGDLPEGVGSGGQNGEEPAERLHRVIGTPSPARARSMLGQPEPSGGEAEPSRELPTEPPSPVSAKRAELVVATLFIVAMLAGFGFIASYVIFQVHTLSNTLRSNLALGGTLAIALLAQAVGATIWVRRLMPVAEYTEERKPMRSTDDDRAAFAQTFEEGAENSQFVKRPLLRRTLIAATVPVALSPLVVLRDLGPLPRKSLDHTVWRKGMRLLNYGANTPIRPADFSSPGGMITVVPDGYQDDFNALAKAACIIIKFAPGQLQQPTVMNWTVDNIVCYSKICTHVGCPAALYEQTTHHILCPCHQSTFDAAHGAKVIFGPATRPLPQLPMTVDAEGYLVASSDFTEPVGPSFWERG